MTLRRSLTNVNVVNHVSRVLRYIYRSGGHRGVIFGPRIGDFYFTDSFQETSLINRLSNASFLFKPLGFGQVRRLFVDLISQCDDIIIELTRGQSRTPRRIVLRVIVL